MTPKHRRQFLQKLGIGTLAGFASPAISLAKPFQSLSNDTQFKNLTITKVSTFIIPRAIFVKVETNAGITGWGECSPNSRKTMETLIHQELSPLVEGQNPFNVEPLWDQMYWQNHDLGPSGALPYAIAGIDLALWDIMGKALNVPVYQLLGGQYRKEIMTYGGIPLNNGKVPLKEAIERALALVEKGFKVIKLRMQIREYNLDPIPDATIPYYRAIREALPDDVELFVDPNEGYTGARAIAVGRQLQEYGMKYFESPCPLENHRDTAEVVRALDIPVLAGEKCYTRWQFRDLILEANPDMIQPDVIKAGGITEVKKIADLGHVFFKPVVLHNTKPTLGTAAALHLMASIPNAGPFIEFVEPELYGPVLSVFDEPIRMTSGKLQLPTGPGLGLTPNEGKLRALAAKSNE